MITAAEAKALAEASDAHLEKYLTLIEREIKPRAEKGDRVYECYVADLWECQETYKHPEPNALQQRVINALKAFPNCYGVRWAASGDAYVPRGLADDFGEGPMYQNVCIHIRW